METSKALPIIISSLALSVSVGAVVVSNNGVEVQKQSLAAAEERWQEESAGFVVESRLSLYNTDEDGFTDVTPGSNIAADATTPPHELYVKIELSNTGRFDGVIEEVGFYKSETERVAVSNPFCLPLPIVDPRTEKCPLPRKLDAAGSVRLYLRLSPYLKNEFQCNPYLQNGLKFYVRSANGVVYDTETETGVSSSSYCPTLAPQEP